MTQQTMYETPIPPDCTVSVIIPTYNSSTVLADAIQSVLNQTHAPAEVIVVDDASSDATAAICGTLRNRIRYLRHDRNRKASAARNTGIAASTGMWVAFLDADDTWLPTKLQRQLKSLSANPNADFCITGADVWSESKRDYLPHSYDGCLDRDTLRADLLIRNIFTGLCSSLIVRRDALNSVGGFANGRGCEDRRIALELLRQFHPIILPDCLIQQRPGPAHWHDPTKHRRAMLRLLVDYDRLYHDLDPTGRLKRRAIARIHERTGMHHLENGDFPAAARNLARAAATWPFTANPWRVLVNACLGRIKVPAELRD
ncbi:MAG: glycosyltransferase family 2 protein [Planctomycetota bacterium]